MILYKFLDKVTLEEHLFQLNYDQGVTPEFACVDADNNAFLVAGTDCGDEMGIAYYFTGPEGRMYHYGSEYEGTDVDLNWEPKFPVVALGSPIADSPSAII